MTTYYTPALFQIYDFQEGEAIIAGDAVAEIVEKLQSNNRNLN